MSNLLPRSRSLSRQKNDGHLNPHYRSGFERIHGWPTRHPLKGSEAGIDRTSNAIRKGRAAARKIVFAKRTCSTRRRLRRASGSHGSPRMAGRAGRRGSQWRRSAAAIARFAIDAALARLTVSAAATRLDQPLARHSKRGASADAYGRTRARDRGEARDALLQRLPESKTRSPLRRGGARPGQRQAFAKDADGDWPVFARDERRGLRAVQRAAIHRLVRQHFGFARYESWSASSPGDRAARRGRPHDCASRGRDRLVAEPFPGGGRRRNRKGSARYWPAMARTSWSPTEIRSTVFRICAAAARSGPHHLRTQLSLKVRNHR